MGFEHKSKRARKREFFDEMNLVVPWAELVALIVPHAPTRNSKSERPPFALQTMLRIRSFSIGLTHTIPHNS